MRLFRSILRRTHFYRRLLLPDNLFSSFIRIHDMWCAWLHVYVALRACKESIIQGRNVTFGAGLMARIRRSHKHRRRLWFTSAGWLAGRYAWCLLLGKLAMKASPMTWSKTVRKSPRLYGHRAVVSKPQAAAKCGQWQAPTMGPVGKSCILWLYSPPKGVSGWEDCTHLFVLGSV